MATKHHTRNIQYWTIALHADLYAAIRQAKGDRNMWTWIAEACVAKLESEGIACPPEWKQLPPPIT